jgi:hypothetical protein
MGPRQPRPFEQGELDGLCGVYSMINSLNWALHSLRASQSGIRRQAGQLTAEERESLFASAVGILSHRPDGLCPVVHGINGVDLARVLKKSAAWLQEKRGLQLGIRRPFYHRMRVTTRRLCLVLTDHLEKPGTAAIIGVEPPWQHWTVVVSVSAKRPTLLDSSGASILLLKTGGRYLGRDMFLLHLSAQRQRE